jgi:hypothetical protein
MTLGQHRNLSWNKTSFDLLGINFDVDLDKIVNINYNERILQIKKLRAKINKFRLIIFNPPSQKSFCNNSFLTPYKGKNKLVHLL